MDLRTFLMLLHLCEGIGNANELRVAAFLRIYQRLPTKNELTQVLKLTPAKSHKLIAQLECAELVEQLRANLQVCQVVTILDEDYPLKLRESFRPPTVLFYQGKLALLKKPCLAIVGARQADAYALEALTKLLKPVLDKGIVTISGLAKGVDALCHQLTLAANQATIGVIGTGLDSAYPRQNRNLQTKVAKTGLLLSEYPLGAPPLRHHFPERNRIIAGLCDSILVVEAQHHSGSLITANLALQNNRNVLAVPGKITSDISCGCNELIAAGAKLVSQPDDILAEFANQLI